MPSRSRAKRGSSAFAASISWMDRSITSAGRLLQNFPLNPATNAFRVSSPRLLLFFAKSAFNRSAPSSRSCSSEAALRTASNALSNSVNSARARFSVAMRSSSSSARSSCSGSNSFLNCRCSLSYAPLPGITVRRFSSQRIEAQLLAKLLRSAHFRPSPSSLASTPCCSSSS